MRRLKALLATAGLVAAPLGAAAGPSVELHEFSIGKGRLGVMVMSLTPELREHFGATKTTGVLVGSIDPDSPAAKAGVRVGDVIVETNDRLVDDAGDIREAMAAAKKGDAVKLDLVRDRKPLTLEAKLDADAPAKPMFDAWLRDFWRSFEPIRPAPRSTQRT